MKFQMCKLCYDILHFYVNNHISYHMCTKDVKKVTDKPWRSAAHMPLSKGNLFLIIFHRTDLFPATAQIALCTLHKMLFCKSLRSTSEGTRFCSFYHFLSCFCVLLCTCSSHTLKCDSAIFKALQSWKRGFSDKRMCASVFFTMLCPDPVIWFQETWPLCLSFSPSWLIFFFFFFFLSYTTFSHLLECAPRLCCKADCG